MYHMIFKSNIENTNITYMIYHLLCSYIDATTLYTRIHHMFLFQLLITLHDHLCCRGVEFFWDPLGTGPRLLLVVLVQLHASSL